MFKTRGSKKLIDSRHFAVCLVDKLTKNEIFNLYKNVKINNHKYIRYIDKFIFHIKNVHNLSLSEYCEKYLNIDWPICPDKNQKVGYKTYGNNILLNNYCLGGVNKQNCEKFRIGCIKLSRERIGKNNPMYGKAAWNTGLDNNDPRVKAVSSKRIGIKTPNEVKLKQSISAKKRKIHGHTGIKHSSETIEKLRENTARLWAEGRFNKVTSIHVKMREFLQTLQLKENIHEEYQVKYYTLDFAFPQYKIGIECQGTYYHIDPRIYPNGPKDKIQKRNFGRDKAKKTYLTNRGWLVIECWETEINDGNFKEFLLKKLIEAGLIK